MGTQTESELDQLMEQIRAEIGVGGVVGKVSDTPRSGRPSTSEIMRRVKAEIARRRGNMLAGNSSSASGSSEDGGAGFAHWQSVAGAFSVRAQYSLGELLKYSDEDFLHAAYRAVLRRSPDEVGLSHYLSRLRDGHTSKVEVLGDLRWSTEGQTRGVHIDGLLIPYTLWKWKRKRFIGHFIRWFHAFLMLGRLLDRQAAQKASQDYEVHALGRTLNALSSAVEHWQVSGQEQLDARATVKAVDDVTRRLDARAEATAKQAQAVLELLPAMTARVDDLERKGGTYANSLEVRSLDAAISGLRSRVEQIAREQASGRASIASLAKEALHVQQHVEHMERVWSAQTGAPNEQFVRLNELGADPNMESASQASTVAHFSGENEVSSSGPDLDPFYAAFEDRFRGDRSLVRQRAEPYLDWIKAVGAGTANAPVLDIGCGRGEWLELLREHGLVAKGIDLNRVFADICRGYGLDVIEGDAIAILCAMPSASIGAITSMHLVEHLSFEQMIVLIDEANRVLVPGGLIVLETPNPENLTVSSHTFYMDPTHRNPIPPEALRWIVEARGFYGSTIERLTTARELNAPPLLQDDIPGAQSINALLSSLHAAPDYSIVAKKL